MNLPILTVCLLAVLPSLACRSDRARIPAIDLDSGVTVDTTDYSTGRPATPAQRAGLEMAITMAAGQP